MTGTSYYTGATTVDAGKLTLSGSFSQIVLSGGTGTAVFINTAEMSLLDGADVEAFDVHIGYGTSTSGTLTLSNNAIIRARYGAFVMGDGGSGTLNLVEGGRVDTQRSPMPRAKQEPSLSMGRVRHCPAMARCLSVRPAPAC